tara:strand:- start:161 stop:391 length:231 start_codon:yes stop_codon:yes gene_type:complete
MDILAQDYGFAVLGCSCGRFYMQVGPMTLHVSGDALYGLSKVLQSAVEKLASSYEFHERKEDLEARGPDPAKKWVQ